MLSGIKKFIPIKKLSTKRTLPWITQEIRRLIRKRDKLYQKQKSGTGKDRYHFNQVKYLVQSYFFFFFFFFFFAFFLSISSI